MKSKLRSGIALGLTLAGIVTMSLSFKAAPGGGNPGDLVATVHFSRDCDGPGGIGVGVAYDGAGHLWISCANDTVDLMRANAATGVVDQTYTIHGGLGALAYDSVHNAIWAGPWGPNDNRVWIIRLDAARNVTSAEPRFVPTAGAARGADDGIAYDASDNSIYYSSDGSTTIGHYNADNSALIDTFTWTGQDSQCANSGLAVGGNYLFQGADGCNHIWVADKHTKANVFHFSTYIANDSNHRDEGLSCDPDTYAASGKEVMWSKEAYSPNRASAFLIPNGTCGAGGQPPPPPSPTPTPTPTATPTPTPTPIGSPTPTPTPTPTATIAACTIVTNTGDSGAGSLRAAIDCANAHPGADTITFNIPSSDPGCHLVPGVGTVCTIQTAGLPIISDTATIDGYTQPGSSPNTLAVGDNAKVLIELDGTNAITSGIYINAPDVTVRGLVINRFHDQGIINDRGNGVFTNTSGTVVEGCFIGVDPTGTIALPNGKDAVSIHGLGAQSIRVGGASPAQRNILSGNGGLSPFGNPIGVGVLIVQQAGGVQVFGNYIGTDRNGTAPIPNVGGVAIDRNGSPNRNQIGGPNPGERNVISGNLNPGLNPGAGYGVALSGGDGDDIVQGNYIGIGADGVTPVGNSEEGVLLGFRNNSPGFLIGGPNPGQGNVISSNGGNGIFSAFSNSNTYQGNLIGTAADGTTPRGNTLNGIICSSSNGETIGGTALGAGNVIAFNGRKGVVLNAGSGGPQSVVDPILGNSIHDNASLGIDLNDDGVTSNDHCDADHVLNGGGANGNQNYPVLTSASSANGVTTVTGTLDSVANSTYRVEFFASPVCDTSGNGEGAVFLGATDVTTGADCIAQINATLLTPVGAGNVVTATATDPNNNTSEFSACIPATVTPPEPEPSPSPTPTALPTSTPTPTATPTISASPTPTPTASATIIPSPTPSPTPTPTATIRPSPTPTPTATAAPRPVTITVTTSPTGLSYAVDGTSYNVGKSFTWQGGSRHTISTTSPQTSGGHQYIWQKWSDNGAISHTISPTVPTAYTATFKSQ